MKNIGIIGSGVGGMAAAVRLSAAGHAVNVYEANDYAGGKLSEKWVGNYRFDVGPSVFTMPNLVDDLFAFSNKENPFRYKKLDITCRYFWEDGIEIVGYADQDAFADEVANKLNISSLNLKKQFEHTKKLFELTKKVFLESSLHSIKTYTNMETVRAIANLHHLDLFTTMNEANMRRLQHPKLVQMFNRYATFNGSSPYRAPGILNVIPHLEHGIGVFAPEGGMYNITKNLVSLAQKNGAKFHYNMPIKEIIHENKTVKGVKTNTQVIDCETVVSNMDVYPTYKSLLKDERQAAKELKQERSLSAIVFYWGINREFPNLDVHNTFFSNDYEAEFHHLIDLKTICDDPTVYVNIGSKYAPDDAPKGHETWFVMINTPPNNGTQDWDKLVATARKNIIAKLNKMLHIDLEALIEAEMTFDPRVIEQRNSTHQGSIYGTSSNDRMAAFFRHPNYAPDYKNLYFSGVAAHPGGGIPLCLLSGKIASEMINNN